MAQVSIWKLIRKEWFFVLKNVFKWRFPVNKSDLLKKWLEACGKKGDWTPQPNDVICGEHFIESDYRKNPKIKLLSQAAVPSLVLPKRDNPNLREGIVIYLFNQLNNKWTVKLLLKLWITQILENLQSRRKRKTVGWRKSDGFYN